jgi:4-diphosphocytidyl-2-C-methyl-D-erythritol kinase
MNNWIGDAALVNAPAKLNLCLHVVGRRSDGYHLIDSVVAPIGLFDDVQIQLGPSHMGHVALRCQPEVADLPAGDNLAVRAARLFLSRIGLLTDVSITLSKRIPIGAGMGGGSSDAAAVLRGLNTLMRTPVPWGQLVAWGLELGADVPFFLLGQPARMRGIGEVLEPCSAELEKPIVVAFPGRGLDTRTVYAKYDDLLTMSDPPSTIRKPFPTQGSLRTSLHNDLEAAAIRVEPALRSLKRQLACLGAESVSMTGSGSAIFGVWKCLDDARAASEYLRTAAIWARTVSVLERVPAVVVAR